MANNTSSGRRPQLRRCASCTKVGHNTARCPKKISPTRAPISHLATPPRTTKFVAPKKSEVAAPKASPTGRGLNFFIHHVNHQPPQSAHIVNLKTPARGTWKEVEPSAPSTSSNPDYHFYHEVKSTNQPTTPPLPSPHTDTLTTVHSKLEPSRRTSPHTYFSAELKTPRHSSSRLSTTLQRTYNGVAERIKKINLALPAASDIITLPRFTAAILIIFIITTIPTSASGYVTDLKTGQQTIITNGTLGFTKLAGSGKQLIGGDIVGATDSTEAAIEHFDTALGALSKHSLLASAAGLIPKLSDQVSGGQQLLLAGQEIAVGNNILLTGIADLAATPSDTPTLRLSRVVNYLEQALPNYERGLASLERVDPRILPANYQEIFKNFRLAFQAGVHDIKTLTDFGKKLPDIFGGEGLRRYLIIFQNPHELRPTGGFMGSFALLEVKDGAIVKLEVPPGGSYDLQGQLDTYLEPPAPLLLTNKRWEFQDANWFADFPTSANKILWFYRHSRGITADGVIAVNASVLERLLTIIGPVTDDKRNLTLSSASALTTIQDIVEHGPEKTDRRPKQILSDLAPSLLASVQALPPADLLKVLFNLEEALEQKEIQAYFTNPEQQNSVSQFGWDGRILPTAPTQDYLFAVNANIRGQKTDAKIKQNITHQAVVSTDGSVIDTVVITREHSGTTGEKLYGEPNSSFLRLYVPKGSELISATGFTWPEESQFRAPETWSEPDELLTSIEKPVGFDAASGTRITEEFGKTVYGNWIITNPGEISRVVFSYRLPFRVFEPEPSGRKFTSLIGGPRTAKYQLVAERQSGADSSFSSQVIFPGGWSPVWNSGEQMSLADNGAAISLLPLSRDQIWSLVMEKN